MKHLTQTIAVICFWSFIAIKLAGTSLALWSWWWILLSPVPLISLLVQHFRL